MDAVPEIYIAERHDIPGAWTVEATDREEGSVDQAIFLGSLAEQRAREYAAWKYGAAPDLTMPSLMPPAVEKALAEVLGFRGKANPVELYDAIRDALVKVQPQS